MKKAEVYAAHKQFLEGISSSDEHTGKCKCMMPPEWKLFI